MKKSILDYLDNEIERTIKATGDYPKQLELSKSSYKRLKKEMKPFLNKDLEEVKCWFHLKKPNYRGIPIKIK